MQTLTINKMNLHSMEKTLEVTNERGMVSYLVNASIGRVPKQFYISNDNNIDDVLATIDTNPITGTTHIEIGGQKRATLKSKFRLTTGKSKITLAGEGLREEGNLYALEFKLYQGDVLIGQIDRRSAAGQSSLSLQCTDKNSGLLMLSLVIAINWMANLSDQFGMG